MPILIVNNLEEPRGLLLDGRVLIGRRPFNRIIIPDPAVSRIHAWVGQRGGRFMLHDAGSRSGTMVNERPLNGPHPLADGDEIRIGPTRITYLESEELPEEVTPLGPAPAMPTSDPYDGGIYFDCACGGPMWVGIEYAGAVGKCRYCGERLVVPHASGQMARPVTPKGGVAAPVTARKVAPPAVEAPVKVAAPGVVPAAATQATASAAAPMTAPVAPPPPEPQVALCSICQTPISVGEERTSCPSCHLTFHAQCWQENYGCSAYGCDQVNVLAPADQKTDEDAAATSDRGATAGGHSFPWEPVMLALSFVATALGALAFGIPSAVMFVAVVLFLLVRKPPRKGLVAVAVLVALLGTAAGYATSMYYWKGVRVWERFLR
jgi:hypothetical protein